MSGASHTCLPRFVYLCGRMALRKISTPGYAFKRTLKRLEVPGAMLTGGGRRLSEKENGLVAPSIKGARINRIATWRLKSQSKRVRCVLQRSGVDQLREGELMIKTLLRV